MRMEIELCTIPTTTACAYHSHKIPRNSIRKTSGSGLQPRSKTKGASKLYAQSQRGDRTRAPCARIPFFHMSHIPWGYARQSEGYNKYHPYKLVSAKHATNKYWRCVNVEDTCPGPSNWHMFASSCERCAPTYTYYIPPPLTAAPFRT